MSNVLDLERHVARGVKMNGASQRMLMEVKMPVNKLLQILMIEADGRGDDGVGGGEDGDAVHAVEHDAVADGEAFALADEGDACGGG
jgi:hypothetical protein